MLSSALNIMICQRWLNLYVCSSILLSSHQYNPNSYNWNIAWFKKKTKIRKRGAKNHRNCRIKATWRSRPARSSKYTPLSNPWNSKKNFSEASTAMVLPINNVGFDKPSAVQQRAIIPIISGRDVIVQSQSGTGKTAVFCLGALQRI